MNEALIRVVKTKVVVVRVLKFHVFVMESFPLFLIYLNIILIRLQGEEYERKYEKIR